MRKSRNDNRGLTAGAARFAGSLIVLLWVRAARRPVDSFAIFGAIAASLVIIVNAVFLQAGSPPAPFFVNAAPTPPAVGTVRPKLAGPPPPFHLTAARQTPQGAVAPHDPIAELIGMSSRIMAVQRVLSDYGYGQIKPTGVLDQPTSAAIEKFEREHNLPVTGRVSGRLVSDLSAMIGRPLE